MLLVLLAALLGIWFCRTRAYFKWAAILFGWMLASSLLFSASGLVGLPTFDGAISQRLAAQAGGAFMLAGAVVHVATTLYCLFRLWDAFRDGRAAERERAEEGSDERPDLTGRRQLETAAIVVLGIAWVALNPPGRPASPLAGTGAPEAAALVEEVAPPAEDTQVPLSVEGEIVVIADEISAEAPKRIDANTVLVGATPAGRTLTYHYKIDAPDVTPGKLRKFIVGTVVPRVCAGDLRPTMRDHAVSYVYSYAARGLAAPVAETVNEQRCAALER